MVGATEALSENLLRFHFVHYTSHMNWDRIQAAEVESRRLTAWAMAQPSIILFNYVASTWINSLKGELSPLVLRPQKGLLYYLLLMDVHGALLG
jgi:hypothetical protein